MSFPDINPKIRSLNIKSFNFSASASKYCYPRQTNSQSITGLLYFSKFEKCDAIPYLHKVTGRNLTGQFFNRPITVARQYTDNKEIADICNKHFVSIGERLVEGIPDTSDLPTAHMRPANCRFVFRKVTTSQVERVIKKLVSAKATGVHNIPNKILKDSCQTIAPFLSDIFNLSISTNTFHNDLKIGKVSPAHKSGDRDNLNNYRPISVHPTIARVFERLLYDQVYTYLTDNKLLGQQQFGFRSIHSTALALGKSINQWLMNVNVEN